MDTAKDAFTNDGYEYFVREGRVDEEGKIIFRDKVYTSNVTGNADDGFIITNTKKKTTSDASTNTEEKTTSDASTKTDNPPTNNEGTNTEKEKINIRVEKIWVGEEKESVTLRLLEAGVERESIKLTSAENWRYEFRDLEKYSNQVLGIEKKYTIVEDEVEGYTSKVEGNPEDGFIITNTKKKTTSDASTNTDNPNDKDNNPKNSDDKSDGKDNDPKNPDDKSNGKDNNPKNSDNKSKDKNGGDNTAGGTATSQGKPTTNSGKGNIPNTGDRSLAVEFLGCILFLSVFVFLSRKKEKNIK